jgi:hypothetical protein
MALRKPRDTVEHDQPAETKVEADIREFVRRDVVTNRERQPENENEMVACRRHRIDRVILEHLSVVDLRRSARRGIGHVVPC